MPPVEAGGKTLGIRCDAPGTCFPPSAFDCEAGHASPVFLVKMVVDQFGHRLGDPLDRDKVIDAGA